jgi:hypothetical protein
MPDHARKVEASALFVFVSLFFPQVLANAAANLFAR